MMMMNNLQELKDKGQMGLMNVNAVLSLREFSLPGDVYDVWLEQLTLLLVRKLDLTLNVNHSLLQLS